MEREDAEVGEASGGLPLVLGSDGVGGVGEDEDASEAALFVKAMESQGGDPFAVFGSFSSLNSKILNRKIRIGRERQRRFMAVPFEGVPEPGAVFRQGASGTALATREGS